MKSVKEIDPEYMIRQIFFYMLILNFIIVVFHGGILTLTQLRAANNVHISNFYSGLTTAPQNPYIRLIASIGCFALIFYCIYVKSDRITDMNVHFLFFSFLEIVAAFILMWEMNMSSNAIIFLITAEMISKATNRISQMVFIAFAFVFYLLCSYPLFSHLTPINNINVWIDYYNDNIASAIYITENLLECINIFVFLMYVMVLLVSNRKEKEQIKSLNQTLQVANNQLLDYAHAREQMGEMKERNRIAREIHDSVGHRLTGLSFGINAVQVLMDENPEVAKKQLEILSDTASATLDDMRRSVRKLAPDALERLGLEQSIYKMIEDTKKVSDVNIIFASHVDNLIFQSDEAEAIYRIIQESVTNAIRHGHASEIWIDINKTLDKNTQNEILTVLIRNNGTINKEYKEGFGLTHMRERVELLGGELVTQAIWGVGFSVGAKIPIRKK